VSDTGYQPIPVIFCYLLFRTRRSAKNRRIKITATAPNRTKNRLSLSPPATALIPPVSAAGDDLKRDRPPINTTSVNSSTAITAAKK
jgi:hypothetical protein